jgi:gamma-glutamyltranspeptidase/glutathione hydrolase
MKPIRLIAVVVLGLCGPASGQVFEKQVVVAQEGHAADIGAAVLDQGGNAVDAAVATAFALAVTHPAAGNLGGGGFLVAYKAETRGVLTFDFRETAPAAATERMYLGSDGTLLPHHRAGPRAAGVPGTVRGLGRAHRELGALAWADLVRPSARLARAGFPISATLARSLNAQLFDHPDKSGVPEDLGPGADRLADFPESVAAFRKPDGTRWTAGDRLLQTDLADTLDRIAANGPDEFYRGRTAELIERHMTRSGGLITRADLAAYESKVRPPIHFTYRGFDIYGMGPPASGGTCLALMLNMLERFDLKADGPLAPRTHHRVAETMRRAFYVRATTLADPDTVAVPTELLISRAYADNLARTITDLATPSAQLAPFPITSSEGEHTTHLSTIDSMGNAVALTYTLEEGYGCKSVVAGAGFLLNNEMGDFNLVPGRTDVTGRIGTPANRIAPGKRMLSSQAPTIVLEGGKVRLVTGSPGGRTIPNTVLWVLLYALEFGLEPRACVDGPRMHHQWFPDVLKLEAAAYDHPGTVDALVERGHAVRRVAIQGDAHTIVVEPRTGRIHGVADRRRATSKASGR